MPTEQEREFELVLGNKQLFSVLFIVIVLLAVFFAMGYVMGRNSAPADLTAKRGTTETTYTRPDPMSASVRRTPEPTPAPTASTSTEAASSANSYPLPTPAPQHVPAAAPAQASSKAASAPSKPIEVAPVSVADPQPGQTYWQVSAVAKPEAELLVEVLTKKHFRAIIAPGPNEKLYRVLVGPARDQAEMSKLRTDLEQAGFKPMLRKY